LGKRVRKDEIRGKGNAEREEERIRGGPRRRSHVLPLRSISLVCSSEHVGQQCPLRQSRPRRTSLDPLYSVHVFMWPRRGYGDIPRRRRVLHRGRAAERCWRALLEIRNVPSSVESRNMGAYLCPTDDWSRHWKRHSSFRGSLATNLHGVDASPEALMRLS